MPSSSIAQRNVELEPSEAEMQVATRAVVWCDMVRCAGSRCIETSSVKVVVVPIGDAIHASVISLPVVTFGVVQVSQRTIFPLVERSNLATEIPLHVRSLAMILAIEASPRFAVQELATVLPLVLESNAAEFVSTTKLVVSLLPLLMKRPALLVVVPIELRTPVVRLHWSRCGDRGPSE